MDSFGIAHVRRTRQDRPRNDEPERASPKLATPARCLSRSPDLVDLTLVKPALRIFGWAGLHYVAALVVVIVGITTQPLLDPPGRMDIAVQILWFPFLQLRGAVGDRGGLLELGLFAGSSLLWGSLLAGLAVALSRVRSPRRPAEPSQARTPAALTPPPP